MGCSNWIAIAGLGRDQGVVEYRRRRRERQTLVAKAHLALRELVDKSGPRERIRLVPTLVVSVANFGHQPALVAKIEAASLSRSDMKASPGWYEEPGAAAGVRRQMLPRKVEAGEIAEFPSFTLGVLEAEDLCIAAIDSYGKRYEIPKDDLATARRQWKAFEESLAAAGDN